MVGDAVSAGIQALQALKESKILILFMMLAYLAPWALLYHSAWSDPTTVSVMTRQFDGVDSRIDRLTSELDQLNHTLGLFFNTSEDCL